MRPDFSTNFSRQEENRAALVFVYDPLANHDLDAGNADNKAEPVLEVFATSSADKAIEYVWTRYGQTINKTAVLGFGMLQAGLTVQTFIKDRDKRIDRVWCPQYVALACGSRMQSTHVLFVAGSGVSPCPLIVPPPVITLFEAPCECTRLMRSSRP